MTKTTMLVSALLGLFAVLGAQEPVAVTDVAIDKLLDGVRVSVACTGSPNVSSYTVDQPPAIVVDVMNAANRAGVERVVSQYYPVNAVVIQASDATDGLRIVIQLRDMVEHKVTSENGVITVQLSGHAYVPAAPVGSGDPFEGSRLTLYVKDADVADVVRMIAQQFNLNMLVTQDVKSVVTVHLNDVSLRTGLEALLRAALCNMVEDASGIIVVKPVKKQIYGETRTRVFNLDYVEAADAFKAIGKVLSENGNAEEGFRRVGSGTSSKRNSVLIVTDIPEALERVAQLLAELDRPSPQVCIEAKFVETTFSVEERYGIAWNAVASFSTAPMDFGQEAAIPVVLPFAGVQQLYFGKLSLAQFQASMEVMANRGRSRLLSNPRTITLDNQTASVSMGVDIPLREVKKDAQTGEITYTWTTRAIPIKLDVTPHVTSDGSVTMVVETSVEAITGWTGSADDQQPVVASRRASTQVHVADGEVVVIGGLVKDEETRNVGKIPLLGDIPILGNLFRKTSVQHNKSELMIFIIPNVLPAEG